MYVLVIIDRDHMTIMHNIATPRIRINAYHTAYVYIAIMTIDRILFEFAIRIRARAIDIAIDRYHMSSIGRRPRAHY